MVTLVCTAKPQKEKQLIEKLSFADSLYWNINKKDTNVIFGAEFILLNGKEQITEHILGHSFSVSPRTFLQVNHAQTERLYSKAIELLAPKKNENAADIYCGMGSITLSLAPLVKTVFGIESVPEAIEDAKRNAEENGIKNAEFYCGEAEILLPKLFTDRQCEAMIIDPPRKGCDPRVLEAIKTSSCERMVYISCNPATLARDLKLLCEEKRFTIQTVQPIDMFPQTGHVETVCLLSKLSDAKHHVEVELNLDEMDLTSAESKATYEEIKAYVQEHAGLNVSKLYIAQTKRKCGIIERENYNLPKSEDSRQPQCPPEKESAIKEALKYFGMI